MFDNLDYTIYLTLLCGFTASNKQKEGKIKMNQVNTLVTQPNPRVLETVNMYMDEPIPNFGKSALSIKTVIALFASSIIGKVRTRSNEGRKALGLDTFTGYDVQSNINNLESETFQVSNEEKTNFGMRLKSLLNATPEGKAQKFNYVDLVDVDSVIIACQQWIINHPMNDKIDRKDMSNHIDGIEGFLNGEPI